MEMLHIQQCVMKTGVCLMMEQSLDWDKIILDGLVEMNTVVSGLKNRQKKKIIKYGLNLQQIKFTILQSKDLIVEKF